MEVNVTMSNIAFAIFGIILGVVALIGVIWVYARINVYSKLFQKNLELDIDSSKNRTEQRKIIQVFLEHHDREIKKLKKEIEEIKKKIGDTNVD